MRLIIEPTGEMAELPNGHCGEVWKGNTQDGTPIVTVLVSLSCSPEHQAALARAMHPHDGADAELPDTRRKVPRRCSWQDRLFGTPPLVCGMKGSGNVAKKSRSEIH